MIELINMDGKETPMIVYKPYIYAIIQDYTKCFTVETSKGIKVVEKGEKYEKRNREES